MNDETKMFIKSEAKQQLGVVIWEADVPDAVGDWASADTIHKGLLGWAAAGFPLKLEHDEGVGDAAFVYEAFQAPGRVKVGQYVLQKGDLYASIQVLDSELWADISENKKYTGISMGGRAKSRPTKKTEGDV